MLLQEVNWLSRRASTQPLMPSYDFARNSQSVHLLLKCLAEQCVVNADALVSDFGFDRSGVNQKDRRIVLGYVVNGRHLLEKPVLLGRKVIQLVQIHAKEL